MNGSIGIVDPAIVSFAHRLWALVELGCLRGTIGRNQYGPDPLAPTAGATHLTAPALTRRAAAG